MNIQDGSLFIDKDGRTIKVKKIDGTGPKDKVEFHIDGSKSKTIHTFEVFNKMLESGGYKDITQTFSGFSFFKGDDLKKSAIGYVVHSPNNNEYTAEIIKHDHQGMHIQFSKTGRHETKIYIYDEKDFDITWIFTPELISELDSKFDDVNVFEVVGVYKDGPKRSHSNLDAKFTVLGKTINRELLDKINKVYNDVEIYSVKRLTSVNIQ